MSRAAILIPAHNEAAVIGRTLWYLSRGLPFDRFRVIVIANGCTDATAARARAALPAAEVIETDRAGKCHALNLGYRAADPGVPIVCMDADLDVTAEAVSALVRRLSGGQHAACGKMDVATSDVSAAVRLFYKGWRTNPYFNKGKFGGLFALSAEGAARVFPLPEITADDEFVRRSFATGETAFVPECRFVARAPATLSSLLKVRRRSLRGAREVARMGKASPERGSARAMVCRALTAPSDLLPIGFFFLVTIWVRLILVVERPANAPRWERDLTTRTTG
ncbi:glycosyltransferase family 2 protein [Aestuariicoccus sp. MJ-SS9]|uniref:glycosyltransferase n=1 Tax=Aestuariicoccus sp. MJ-SS9 TaxID=3079855 RepID=UPI002909F26C|nr:glycosyltransferase family 2 protein [Aestuariicoccus sp. MJ-SS9]MDU8913710.1 glycosyltransferase family 2 protein [Aestuariicoccus sp. MJ-SS9]